MSFQEHKERPLERREFIKGAAAGAIGTALTGGWQLGEAEAQEQPRRAIQRIAFGSCCNEMKPQPIWDAIIGKHPDLYLFIGDNIYADTLDMDVMRSKYAKLAAKPGYQRLLETCPVLSTWDDHDYGRNDAGAGYPKKEESEKIFADFFEIPQDSPRRGRPGIYGAYRFGPRGKRVQIILLDMRYFKEISARRPHPATEAEKEARNIVGVYQPIEDPTATLLGEAQWAWLEHQLRQEADLRIIASSSQVVAYEKRMECWGNYPHERRRLFDLIEKTGASGTMFISGDVHFSEVSRTKEGPYPLYDFTSSGMTHSNPQWAQAINSYRIGEAYAGHNAALIHIDWDRANPAIVLQTLTLKGVIVLEHTVKLNDLRVSSGGR